MFSTKLNLQKPFSRLIKKQKLETLDVVYRARPFCEIVSKNQNTYNLDTMYRALPFVGTPNNYIRRVQLVGANHPDVENWLETVKLNGGDAASTTISALNNFCNSIDNFGLRSKFYRLNLFCGYNLKSALIPIFTRSIGGLEYGDAVDGNVGFLDADYTEQGLNGGLKGDGSTKHLRPKMIVSRPTGNESVGVYVNEEASVSTPSGTYYLVGSHSPSNNNRSLGILYYNNQYWIEDGTLGISPNGTFATSLGQSVGFRCASSNGLSSRKMYLNGNVIFSNTNTTTASINPIYPYLWARSDSGNAYGLGNQRVSAYFIGTSMTDTDMYNLNSAMQTFQTVLNRNV